MPTSFVGRSAELQRLSEELSEGRLVSIVGPPGIGKTRLVKELVGTVSTPSSFCDLTAARREDDVLATVGRALGAELSASSADATERLVAEAIGTRGRMLLVLDNFEQIVELAASTVGTWLGAATDARFVVTSRQPLGLAGERVIELGGLLPADAEELFVARSRVSRPELVLGPADREAMEEVIDRLDAIPLALELAAALSGVMTPRELRDRLTPSLPLLGPRGSGERQTTMRAAIDWSWELLGEPERRALAQCAVFQGGFTLDAAEAVVVRDALPVAMRLDALRQRSLLVADEVDGGLRFRLLECIREFAADHTPAEAMARHADWSATEGERWAAGVEGPDNREHLGWLVCEQDNLLAAHRWAMDADPVLAARLAVVLDRSLHFRGPFALRLRVLEEAASVLPEGEHPELACLLRTCRGVARLDVKQYPEAIEDLERAAEIAPDRCAWGRATFHIGNVLLWQERFHDARARFEEALEALGQSDPLTTSKVLNNLAMLVAGEGRFEEAIVLYERAAESAGTSTYQAARSAPNLALLHHQVGDLERARMGLSQAAGELDRQHDHYYLCFATLCLAWVDLDAGMHDGARIAWGRAGEVAKQVGDPSLLAIVAATGAVLAAEDDAVEQAEDGFREARALLREIRDPGVDDMLSVFEGFLDVCRSRADPEHAEAHRARARERLASLEERIARGEVVLSEVRVPMRLLEGALEDAGPARERLEVGTGWFRIGEERVDLRRRKAMRRLFDALVARRVEEPGIPTGLDEARELAWPGERMDAESASRRVYLAIHSLRKLGLGERLVRTEGGYYLDPGLPIVRIKED